MATGLIDVNVKVQTGLFSPTYSSKQFPIPSTSQIRKELLLKHQIWENKVWSTYVKIKKLLGVSNTLSTEIDSSNSN